MSEVGYKKPPKDAAFKPGQSGNPGGKSSEQRRLEIENAEIATQLRSRLLRSLVTEFDEIDAKDGTIAGAIKTEILKLIKDSEDRGLGTPIATVQGTGEAGAIVFQTIYETK